MPGLLPINLGGLLPHPLVIRDVTGVKMTMGQFLQMGRESLIWKGYSICGRVSTGSRTAYQTG